MQPDVLAHGRTVAGALALADYAARTHFSAYLTAAQRRGVARDAVTAALLEAARPPADAELVRAAQNAISAAADADRQYRGIDRDGATRPQAARYWTQPELPFEDTVVETVAVRQAMAALSPSARRDLLALAEHGDRDAAARALGADPATYKRRLGPARAEFRALWHEGEQPSRHWARDRPGAARPGAAVTAMRRRARRRAAAASEQPVNAA